VESIVEKLFETLIMVDAETSGGGGHYRSSTKKDLCILFTQMFLDIPDSWLNIGPRSCILGLFLCPHHFGVFVLFHFANNFLEWEWAKGLDSENCSVILVKFLSFSLEVIVYLA